MATSDEVQASLLDAIKVCSDATTGAVIRAMQIAFDDKDVIQAGGMAATASQSAIACRELVDALSKVRDAFPANPAG